MITEIQVGERWQYACDACGKTFRYAVRKPLDLICCQHQAMRKASVVQDRTQHYMTCPHRGPAIATINANAAGCGCSGSTVQVYHCNRFDEPVLKQASDRCVGKIQQVDPKYTGRTCRACNPQEDPVSIPQILPPPCLPPVTTLAVVTCYFNPQRSATRRANWEMFADRIRRAGVPLLTVEGVAPDGAPELVGSLAIECRDVLWHKERLLNVGIQSLPSDVDAVAWMDADLVFDRTDIRTAILDALCRWPVIQPWSECVLIGRDGKPHGWFGDRAARSLAAVNAGRPGDAHPHKKHPGFAWAARRETLESIGDLYDRHITGGGDTAMAIGFYGDLESVFLREDRMSEAMMSHWRRWAERAASVVAGRVGYIAGTIRHLYHGELSDRQYLHRWTKLAAAGFDPDRHVAIGKHGSLEWTPDAPERLREYVADYLLHQRKEP